MICIKASDFQQMERFFRANLINALSGFKPAILIGTKNKHETENLALFQNVFHLGADPAIIGIVNRPEAATPHTLNNIRNNGFYTLNACTVDIMEKAHQCSAKYGEDISEFQQSQLNAFYTENFNVPYVKESPVCCGVELLEIIPIHHNGTFIILGNIIEILMDDQILNEDGFVSLDKASIICTGGLDAYFQPQFLKRLPYAKPKLN